jgi:alkylation response protein AidB-like acyl-CoA dehydrogenase
MYSFEPTEEQRMLIDAVERYAENDLRPAAREADETGELPQELIEKGWELGVLQASIPEAYQGFGERYTAAFIEPEFDFSPIGMKTSAVKDKKEYVINGTKAFVPFADQAQSFLVFADYDGRTQAFIVPGGEKGCTVGEREKLLGIHALPTYPLLLEEVRVPLDARVGGEDGFDIGPVLASAHVATAAMAVGVSKAALDYVIPYAKEREVWGKPIAQKQSIAFMLVEMATEIESIRMLVWEAAWMLDVGKDAAKAAYLAFTGASDMAMMVTDSAVQVLGGHGYIREHPVEMWMRNGRGIPAFAGMAMV